MIPLRAYARVVLRGLPASETSHHLWSETKISKRGDIARCRGSNPRVRAKLFFAFLLRGVKKRERGLESGGEEAAEQERRNESF